MARADRTCTHCAESIPSDKRSDARFCSDKCRSAAWFVANREHAVALNKAWIAANPGRGRRATKEQRLEERRLSRLRNLDHERARARWRAANASPERRAREKEYKLAWAAAHPEVGQAWVRANRVRAREYKQRWVAANPDKSAELKARRRARERSAPLVEKVDRKAVIARDDSTCYLCHVVCAPRDPNGPRLHLDHVVPLSRGGEHTAANLAVLCIACNSRKGTKLISELDWL